jgi:hypothetical protein
MGKSSQKGSKGGSAKKRKYSDSSTSSERDDESLKVTKQESMSNNSNEEKSAVEAKREYNRQSAARARKRQKELIAELQDKHKDVCEKLSKQEHENDILREKLKLLQSQNEQLMNIQVGNRYASSAPNPPVNAPPQPYAFSLPSNASMGSPAPAPANAEVAAPVAPPVAAPAAASLPTDASETIRALQILQAFQFLQNNRSS